MHGNEGDQVIEQFKGLQRRKTILQSDESDLVGEAETVVGATASSNLLQVAEGQFAEFEELRTWYIPAIHTGSPGQVADLPKPGTVRYTQLSAARFREFWRD